MFHDETTPFPYDVLKLGLYLSISIAIGLDVTTKILMETEQCSTSQHINCLLQMSYLTKMGQMPENTSWLESMKDWVPMSFQENWKVKPYEDETQNEQSFCQLEEELEPMPKVGDHYTHAEILHP